MRIEIENKISDTSMEIYEFDVHGKKVDYVGIMYSNRNDKNDAWGHKWDDPKYLKKEKEELEKYIKEFEVYSLSDNLVYDSKYDELCDRVNPICNKTKDGKPYYHGTFWGYNSGRAKIKMSREKLMTEILKKMGGLKFNFDDFEA
jgi:hypothetical protein